MKFQFKLGSTLTSWRMRFYKVEAGIQSPSLNPERDIGTLSQSAPLR